jgi:tRNA:m4X modification enzyme
MSCKNESWKERRERKRKRASERDGKRWDRCMFWMERKHRYCCMPRSDGIMYCGAHDPNQKRIPCTFDPTHTVRENEIESHLKKCPAYRKICELKAKSYYACDCNAGDKVIEDICDAEEKWEDLENFEKWLSGKLEILRTYCTRQPEKAICNYAEFLHISKESEKSIGLVKEYERSSASSSSMSENSTTFKTSSHEHTRYMKFSAERHRKQHEGIVSVLREHDLIDNFRDSTIIEFGSGRAGLSWALNCVLNEDAKKTEKRRQKFLLVDRDRITKKSEKYFSGTSFDSATRICMDIRHLRLEGVPELCSSSSSTSSSSNHDISSLSKHLCGAATDLSLRCLYNFTTNEEKKRQVRIISFALCCHGVCSWQEFVGRSYFRKLLKFKRLDFEKIAKSSGWMVGYGSMSFHPDIDMKTRLRYMALGRACKRLIDAGRILFLVRDMGMKNAALVPYCDKNLTPENMLLLAWDSQ